MNEMLLDVRGESDSDVLDTDILTILDHGKKMVTNNNYPKVQNTYECNQNL